MSTIVIDPGHGGADAGAVYKGNYEKDFNLAVARIVQQKLLRDYVVDVIMTRTGDQTISLNERTALANVKKADFFLSIHHNAGGGSGFESYIYNGNVPSSTKQYQAIIHSKIIKSIQSKYQVKDRGQKRANFQVVRETKMDALLLEIAFVDNEQDLKLLNNSTFIREVSNSIADGVANALDLPKKSIQSPSPPDRSLYKVIAGSFKENKYAEIRTLELKNRGINAFVVQTEISGQMYYRVQAGAFSNRENADLRVEEIKKMGINGAFVVVDDKEGEELPPKSSPAPQTIRSIEGEAHLLSCQLDLFAKTINMNAPRLGEYYVSYGDLYGIRGDIAYAQALLETNFFQFNGLVKENQNNFAGLGAIGSGSPGASFQSPEEGVHAQIQHLYAYATTKNLPAGLRLIDPRFKLVSRGSANAWTDLNGKWAVPGTNYGESILAIYRRMVNFTIEQIKEQQEQLQKIVMDL
ncbi:N-acetylmuramoyl-L-alanine amidase [Cytobacillus spongiae]|jgi:N-acetylmuramoyl-L-alanine amidase|uniref:N-acetylmuramoyl-L-alanine amidase n=1 Tax=Cytobacillus spongiae TaxID=2901381 RepID=UPI001F32729C|nr:N-acetylmuramoyl-L-alanine amidase [Cytobacillus spongiae]UII57100.1 N-acetylmuramoyl-L-alanine amidase [Cytobacillus spongiae]